MDDFDVPWRDQESKKVLHYISTQNRQYINNYLRQFL